MAKEKDNSGLKQTKIEKTSDKTFNVHTEDGGHYECKSPVKLDNLKTVTHIKNGSGVFQGIGERTGLICDVCSKVVLSVSGKFDKTLKKMVYHCNDCK